MRKSSGQALLIVLLVLSVALTAGLSLVARTTTDVSISKKETESNKAFEAAEAGIEEALKRLEGGNIIDFSIPESQLESGASINVEFSSIGGTDQPSIRTIRSGESATFWLNSFELDEQTFPSDEVSWPGGNLIICWDDEDVDVEAVVYFQNGEQYGSRRYYDGGGGVCSGDFNRGMTILGLATTDKFVNVRFYDTDTNKTIRISAQGQPNNLPLQGTVITSQGQVADVSRRVQIVSGWPELPSFFDFVLFSGGSLEK